MAKAGRKTRPWPFIIKDGKLVQYKTGLPVFNSRKKGYGMGGEIKQRHHMKAMILSGLVLIVVIFFIMWLKGQAAQQPVPTAAVNDVKSTEWKKSGTDKEGDHFYRFDESSKAFPDS